MVRRDPSCVDPVVRDQRTATPFEPSPERDDRGSESPVEAQRERPAARLHRGGELLEAGEVQGGRFLQEDRLADAGARQIIDLEVESLQTSCGFGVPLFDYAGEREQLHQWIEKKGPEGVRRYQQEKNTLSIDGKPTSAATPCP